MKNIIKICLIIISSFFLFGFTSELGIKTFEIENYDIKFDPEITIYNLIINTEDKLVFIYELESGATLEIIGNENLKPGSSIFLKLNYKDIKRTYKINISEEESFTYNKINNDVKDEKVPLKSIISLVLILISIIEIFFIIRALKKSIK